MLARKLQVSIPADHRLIIDLPVDLPAGPAEIIVLVQPQTPAKTEMSDEERLQAIRRAQGSWRDRLSDSESFAEAKRAEIEREDRHADR